MGPKAPGVYQLSQATQAWVQGPVVDQLSRVTQALAGRTAGLARHPAGLGPVPEGPSGGAAFPDYSVSCPRAREVDLWFGPLGPMPSVQHGRLAVPGVLGLGPRSHGVDQLFQVIRDLV